MIEIDLTLTLRSPLNIGSGAQQGTLAQRGMLKDADGWPYIPASAIKGRWRHAVEQVAASLAWQPPICATHEKMCREGSLCVACQLFGSPWQPGALRFVDLPIVGPPAIVDLRSDAHYRPRTTQRTGVTLNRSRRVAQDQFLFDTELFWPGIPLVFGGRISGDINRQQAGLLLAGLHHLPALGRGKSAGLGWVQAEAVIKDTAQDVVWTAADLRAALNGEETS